MQAELKLSGLDGVLETLKRMPPEIVSKNGGPARSALRKGALVILNQEKANLQAVTSNQTEEGHISTGLLAKNLIVSRGKPPTGEKGERQLVRVRKVSYERGGKTTTTQQTANWLEWGTSQQPAEPFIRPAVLSRAPAAIETIRVELLKGIDRIATNLFKLTARKN